MAKIFWLKFYVNKQYSKKYEIQSELESKYHHTLRSLLIEISLLFKFQKKKNNNSIKH